MLFIYFFSLLLLAVLSLSCCMGFSLVVANGGCSLVAVCGLLIVVTSLVGKHRLLGAQASVVVALGLNSCCSRT